MVIFATEGKTMSKTVGGKLKLLRLRDILLERTDENHCMSVPQIIEALESYGIYAERKSIYSDLDCLEQYGMDIIKTQTGYCVGNRDFELSELKILVDVVQASRFLTARKTVSLIGKIMKLAPKSEAATLQRSVVISGRVKTPNEKIYYNVDVIQNAIRLSKKIRFKYFSYGEGFEKQFRHGGEDYIENPVALMWNDENYYLVSNGIQEIRENGFGRENIPAMMAAVVVISVPLIILFLIFRNKIMEGVSRGGTKG